MAKLRDRLRRVWSAFNGRDHPSAEESGSYSSYRPDRTHLRYGRGRTEIAAIYNRLALDVASVPIRHVQLNEDGQYVSERKSGLNNCLSLSANKDQTSDEFIHDLVMSMFDEGVVAVAPVETDTDPNDSDAYDILSLRVGKIVAWYPDHVKLDIYDDRIGRHREITVSKDIVAIIENPFYAVMNEANAMLDRVLRKQSLLDTVDNDLASKKLNMFIKTPYDTSSEIQKNHARKRMQELENQLEYSKFGMSFLGVTEDIIQINRPLENNLLDQVAYYTDLLYSQLGITKDLMTGTASEEETIHYMRSIIEPILVRIAKELKRKFLSPTARAQNQSIEFRMNYFRLGTVEATANVISSLKRDEIISANEARSVMGFKPLDLDRANIPINSNINPFDPSAAMEEQQMLPDGMDQYQQEQLPYPTEYAQPQEQWAGPDNQYIDTGPYSY